MNVEHNTVVLTVADHDANGFIGLCSFRFSSEAEARAAIKSIDDRITDEMEPDIKTAPFTFILDLTEPTENDCVDNGRRLLPTQEAMRLAPTVVQEWLESRPDPEAVFGPTAPRHTWPDALGITS